MLGGGAGSEREIDLNIERIRARMAAIEAERVELEAVLRDLLSRRLAKPPEIRQANTVTDATIVTTASPGAEKIALFRRLFTGRPDVFPVRWENQKTAKSGYAPACANEWVRGICGKPRVKCGDCPHQAFIPVTDEIIEKHLRGGDGSRTFVGDFVAGVYPLLPDETCWFLAADFDEENWASDAMAMLKTCHAYGVPAALERSRSGNGVLIQSLVRQGGVSDLVADYGHLVVDECHHLSATSFELVARRAKARFVLGLSATVARKDGHHPIIFMQCGPVRHRVDARRRPVEGFLTARNVGRPNFSSRSLWLSRTVLPCRRSTPQSRRTSRVTI